MIVHLHASCWNEARMLPFFFRHYDRFVDHYFIRDNQSDDASLEILAAHPRVTVQPLYLPGDSFAEAGLAQVNQFWWPSRGKADWIAVCNIDELFWHPDLKGYLGECRDKGITFLGSSGYQMISTEFPAPGDDLPFAIRSGVPAPAYDKPSFFNPDAITNSGFAIGRHRAKPAGNVVRPAKEEILLLHYKYLGPEYVNVRNKELNARRRPRDIAKGYGAQYDPFVAHAQYESFRAKAREVVPAGQRESEPRLSWPGKGRVRAKKKKN